MTIGKKQLKRALELAVDKYSYEVASGGGCYSCVAHETCKNIGSGGERCCTLELVAYFTNEALEEK